MSAKYVSFIEGLKSALPEISSESRVVGAFYVTTDTNEIFVSEQNGYNKLSDVVIVEHENQLPLAGTQKSNKIYYVSDTNSLYTVKTGQSGPEWVRSGEDTFAKIDQHGAVALANALYLQNNVGSVTKGTYFNNGVPEEMTYSVEANVPSDAVFTDTTYTQGNGVVITNDNVIKAKLQSENQSLLTAEQKGSTANREYAVGLDANGNLSVNVPWTNSGGGGGGSIEGYLNETDGKFYEDSLYTIEIPGEAGMIYVTLDTDLQYRFETGTGFVQLSESIELGETSDTAYRGDRGKTAYDHASDTNKLTTAQASGLYKIATTAQGHIASVTAVQKSDITALGIPSENTTYEGMTSSEATTGTSTTNKLISAKVLNDAIVNKGYTKNTGTVTSVATGAGLTGGTITGSGILKANLKSETKSSLTAAAKGNTANREYAVGLDANGNLSVNVPWVNTNVVTSVNGQTGDITITAEDVGSIDLDQKGAADGVAELDSNGKVPSSQLPSFVDDVIEGYLNGANGKFYRDSTYTTEIPGESGKIYVTLDKNITYRWSGSVFTEISASLALGETDSTAYRGDRGKTAYDHASDSAKLTTAQASGLYKIATTAQGHIAGVSAVQKSDITALGIPSENTTYTGMTSDIAKAGTETTNKLISAKVLNDAIVNKGYTKNTGTVTSVAGGAGLTGSVTTTGTIKANLKSETKSSLTATSKGSTANREYAVGLDANGNLSVNVPWVNTNVVTSVNGQTGDITITAEDVGSIDLDQKGAADGVATLDSNRKITSSQLPSLLALGETDSTAYRGDRGKTAYDHASDSAKLTTAKSSGLYKIATTVQGHIASVTAVQKSDITALGIPSENTTYTGMTSDIAKAGTETTNKLISAKVLNDAIVNKGYTKNTGTVTSVATGAGLTGGTITGSGTLKANLKSETKSSLTAAAKGSTASREYAVGLDSNGNLSVNVPWVNTSAVTSVNGKTGDITITAEDVGSIDLDQKGAANGVATLDSNSKLKTAEMPASGVTAGTAGSTTAQTPSFGGTFNVPYVTVDTYGRTTAKGTATVKIPNSAASSSAAGLMSSAHYTKVSNLPVFSSAVNAAVGATSVTISNSSITTNSLIEPQCSTSSGMPVIWQKMVATAGQVVITFANALTEAASIRVRITNSFS